MPRISQFLGIYIYLYYNDHMPSRVHEKYAKYEAIILKCASHIRSGGHHFVMLSAAKHLGPCVRCFAALSMTNVKVT
jgi:hypothetical protein